MAVDEPRWQSGDRYPVKAVRISSLAAAFCALAVVVWTSGDAAIGGTANGIGPATIARGLEALWVIQASLIALLGPPSAGQSGWSLSALRLASIIAVPLPLFAVGWLAEATRPEALALGLLLQIAEALLVLGAAAIFSRCPGASIRGRIAVLTTQVLILSTVMAAPNPFEAYAFQ